MTPLRRIVAEAARPADTRDDARKRVETPKRLTAGTVFLAACLACGTGFPQNAPAPEDEVASPILRQGTIREEDLSEAAREPTLPVRETGPGTDREPAPTPGPPLASPPPNPTPAVGADPEDSGGPEVSYELPRLPEAADAAQPQRTASMKLVQQGRLLLRNGQYRQALATFERAIGMDSANPYSHYFVAQAHYSLGNHRESLSFLDAAEPRLAADARWLAEIQVLRARNATALGFHGQADDHYLRALRLDPGHGFALSRLTTFEPAASTPRSR